MLRFGTLEVRSNLFLSPLAGYTNLPFRLTVRELGGLDLCTTDLVNARSLLERNPRALQLVETCHEDSPLAVQLFGSVAEEMRDAAMMLEQRGIASIDVNMGCPVRKVTKIGGGSAMMTEVAKTAALLKGMIDAVKIPVTAKMRLGWDEENLTAPVLARALEDVGAAAIFVHGRTRAQGFAGRVNLAGIRAVVEAVSNAPVIGNGDVTTPEAARVMLAETGCAGVSIGRGAFYNPWIFAHTRTYLDTGVLPPEATFDERVRVMTRHFERYIAFYGDERGALLFRKVAPWYAKRFGPSREFKRHIVTMRSRADYDNALARFREWRAQFLGDDGELRDKFQPKPLEPSFLRPEGDDATERESIPVPKGPVENW
ncbi:MAG TPA: tRNA dihydrouridine synthase DusB [Opitutaceae bacterium]|nr:tRNA dihydrouridine synthase DusB [Opitutaceae bacterium]